MFDQLQSALDYVPSFAPRTKTVPPRKPASPAPAPATTTTNSGYNWLSTGTPSSSSANVFKSTSAFPSQKPQTPDASSIVVDDPLPELPSSTRRPTLLNMHKATSQAQGRQPEQRSMFNNSGVSNSSKDITNNTFLPFNSNNNNNNANSFNNNETFNQSNTRNRGGTSNNNMKKDDMWDLPLPDLDTKPAALTASLDSSFKKDEDPGLPTLPSRRGGMKPPLSKKGSEKALDTFPTENSVFPSNLQKTVKINTDNGLEDSHNNRAKSLNSRVEFEDVNKSSNKGVNDQELKNIKKLYQNLLQQERTQWEKRLEEEKNSHQKTKQSMERMHKEELDRKLNIKQLQINKMKEFYEMEIESKKEQLKQLTTTNEMLTKLTKNTEIVDKWDNKLSQEKKRMEEEAMKEIESKTKRMMEEANDREAKAKRKEQEVYEMEKSIREELNSQKQTLRNQYKRIELLQDKLMDREKQLDRESRTKELDLNAKMSQVRLEQERKKRELDTLRDDLLHEKHMLEEHRREYEKRHTDLMEERHALMTEVESHKRTLRQKEMEVETRLKNVMIKQTQLSNLTQEYKHKNNLLDLEKKRTEINIDESKTRKMLIKTTTGFTGTPEYYNASLQDRLNAVKNYANSSSNNATTSYEPMLKKTLGALRNNYI